MRSAVSHVPLSVVSFLFLCPPACQLTELCCAPLSLWSAGRMRQNKLEHDMETLSASLLATNTDTRDQVSQAIQANRAANLATATAVETSLAAKVTAMATEQTDRRTDRDVVEAALTTMASDVASRHATALTAATTALTDTQTRIDAAHAAMGTEATRVHTLCVSPPDTTLLPACACRRNALFPFPFSLLSSLFSLSMSSLCNRVAFSGRGEH